MRLRFGQLPFRRRGLRTARRSQRQETAETSLLRLEMSWSPYYVNTTQCLWRRCCFGVCQVVHSSGWNAAILLW